MRSAVSDANSVRKLFQNMREILNGGLKIVVSILIVFHWNNVAGQIADDLVTQLYQMYEAAVHDGNKKDLYLTSTTYLVIVSSFIRKNGYDL